MSNRAKTSKLLKTKYAGVYFSEDPKTKVKTYIARIVLANIIDTEVVVGYSNDTHKTNAALAYQRRLELIQEAKSGKNIKSKDCPTLQNYFETYIESKSATTNKKWEKNLRSFFELKVENYLKAKKVKEITTEDLQKIVNKMIEDKYSGRYIKTTKELFGPMLDIAVKTGLIETNPVNSVNFPKFDNKRVFYLPDDKIKALYEEIMEIPQDDYRLMFMFLLRGRRMNEVLSLEWSDIDLANKKYRIRAENYKTRRGMDFILDDEMVEHLVHFAKYTEQNGLIFKSRVTGEKMDYIPRRLWTKIKEKLDLKTMSPHDFRHLVGFTLVNNDVPIEIISKTLGHAQISTTQRYSNMKEEMAAKGVDAFLGLIKK